MNKRNTPEQEKHTGTREAHHSSFPRYCTVYNVYEYMQRQSLLKIHDAEIVVKLTCIINVLFYLYCSVLTVLFCPYSTVLSVQYCFCLYCSVRTGIHFSICASSNFCIAVFNSISSSFKPFSLSHFLNLLLMICLSLSHFLYLLLMICLSLSHFLNLLLMICLSLRLSFYRFLFYHPIRQLLYFYL